MIIDRISAASSKVVRQTQKLARARSRWIRSDRKKGGFFDGIASTKLKCGTKRLYFVAAVSMAIIVGAIFFANSAPKAFTAIKHEGRLEAIARIEGRVDSCRYSVSTYSRSNAAQMVAADRSTGWGDCTDARQAAERDGSTFGSVESRQSFLVAYQDENGHTVHGHWFSFTPDAFAIGDHVLITYDPEATQSLTVLRKGTERYDPDGSVVGVEDAGAATEISEGALAASDKEKPAFDSSAYPLHVQIIGNIILITVFYWHSHWRSMDSATLVSKSR